MRCWAAWATNAQRSCSAASSLLPQLPDRGATRVRPTTVNLLSNDRGDCRDSNSLDQWGPLRRSLRRGYGSGRPRGRASSTGKTIFDGIESCVDALNGLFTGGQHRQDIGQAQRARVRLGAVGLRVPAHLPHAPRPKKDCPFCPPPSDKWRRVTVATACRSEAGTKCAPRNTSCGQGGPQDAFR